MTRPSARRSPAATVAAAGAAALLALLGVLLSSVQAPARAAGSLRAVTVMNEQGAYEVVVQLDPAPLAPPDSHAAYVTPGAAVPTVSGGGAPGSPSGGSASRLQATIAPVLDLDGATPMAFVVDASASGAAALPQTLSGAAGVMLKLPSTNPVTVVADRAPPALLASGGATPSVGIKALTSITPSGGAATGDALTLAVNSLQPPPPSAPDQPRVRMVLLTTSAPAPQGNQLDGVVQAMHDKHLVLGVVGTGSAGTSWSDVATRTGGLAVTADPSDSSAAYENLLSALQARYVVRFQAPPSVTQAVVTVTSVGAPLSGPVDLSGAAQGGGGSGTSAAPSTGSATSSAAPTARTSTSASSGSGLGSRLWGLVAILLVVAAGVAALAALRLRGRTPAREPKPVAAAEDDEAALLPGVRMFDLSDPQAPAEIAPAAPEGTYQGRHREPGVDPAVVDEDEYEDDVDEDRDEHGDDHRQGRSAGGDGEDARPVKEAG